MKKSFLGYIGAGIGIGAVTALLTSCGSSSTNTFSINGAGATFPAPLYHAWTQVFSGETGNKVNYQSTGSGSGVRQFAAGTVDFGASDAAIPDNKTPATGVVHIPTTGGAIVPAYNLPNCAVKMTQQQLVDVYLGRITNWSEFGCGNVPILVVYRSDGSGTTYGFTSSLSAFSSDWRDAVGTGKSVNWPVGVGSKGNSGVAAQIKQREGAIGYVNYGYVNTGLQQVQLQNRAGNFVTANAETSSAGLSQIQLDNNLRGSDANPAGENSYPIVTLTWMLAYPESKPGVKTFMTYVLGQERQAMADGLGYVPLPENIRQQALDAVDTIQ